ncbi:MAG: class I SAM-dependent RNA methyltransferase [Caldilineaceae bacterium]
MARTRRVRRGARQTTPAASERTGGTPGEIIDLTLTGMAPTGEAIGRYGAGLDPGMVVFVPFGLPGEEVRVRLVERKRSFARGEIVARKTDSPARVSPICPYFARCGGCDWQHMAYAEQLRVKAAIVAEQLQRFGKLPEPSVLPCIGSPAAYEYRNHARLQAAADGGLGYRAARSHTIVPVADCPILEAPLRRELAALAGQPSTSPLAGEVELRSWEEVITVGDFAYRTSEGAFFQANTAVAQLLVESVLAALAPRGGEHVLDLYCGVGLFTVPVGQRVAQIVGVESNSTAAGDAMHNVAAAGVGGRIINQDVAEALRSSELKGQGWDAIILDPPRTGVDGPALAALIALGSPRLLYISCEPSTLARDLRILAANGYHLHWAQPYDMFPQTRHVETLAVLAIT